MLNNRFYKKCYNDKYYVDEIYDFIQKSINGLSKFLETMKPLQFFFFFLVFGLGKVTNEQGFKKTQNEVLTSFRCCFACVPL
jgi:CRISPR/Cas system endoribonuclease Cas6 (RAMP superfamily)